MMKCATTPFTMMLISALFVVGASAFAPATTFGVRPFSTSLFNSLEKGAGGMFDTRNPNAMKHEDARKSINEAPTFEEYMKMRTGGVAAPAPATAAAAVPAQPTAPAPAPAVPTGSWSQPAINPASFPTATGNPPPFSSWGRQPASGNPPPFSNWGQPAAVTASSVVAPPPQTITTSQSSSSPLATSSAAAAGGDPISLLAASQATSVSNIAASIPDLSPKPDLSWNNGNVLIGGCPATLDARDAPGPANVAWLASVSVPGKLSSLTIFNGPLTDVPHLLSRCSVIDNNGDSMMLRLDLDFRPRAYGAYDMIRPDGTYPGPDELGRKAFEYSGARMDFETKFGNDKVKAFLNTAKASFEGATIPNAPPTHLEILTGSPLALSLVMPITNANIAALVMVREQAAAAWLRWTAMEKGQHEHRPGAPINTQYVYDAKFRQNAYSALRPFYSALFGAQDGAQLAAAESGPLDEAYVGGGS